MLDPQKVDGDQSGDGSHLCVNNKKKIQVIIRERERENT